MNWKKLSNLSVTEISSIPLLSFDEIRADMIQGVKERSYRVLSYFVHKEETQNRLFVLLADDSLSTIWAGSYGFEASNLPSLTPEIPALHLFEREIYESTGIEPLGHPWLKALRFPMRSHPSGQGVENYPFLRSPSPQVHEVGVGPVHAGVIEPGHFRFTCHGETILHLETQLGYQHRGMEDLMVKAPSVSMAERISGDSAVAHGLAYAHLAESLAGYECQPRSGVIRAIALELERVAMHVGDLGALLNDVGFLMGGGVFGALRTTVINTSLMICGSRFGMGLVTLGGVNFDLTGEKIQGILENVRTISQKVQKAFHLCIMDQPSVLTRFEGTGDLSYERSLELGLVGPAARASGLQTDVRVDHPFGNYRRTPIRMVAMGTGDVFARAYQRYAEILQSLEYIEEELKGLTGTLGVNKIKPKFPSNSLGIALVEGWRGEICHVGITDSHGKFIKYKIKDPSFNNWFALTLAVRGGGISDFPLINKSFNLSYCGHDL